MDISVVAHDYNKLLSDLLDKHAPLKTRFITLRPAAPWYTDDIKISTKDNIRKVCWIFPSVRWLVIPHLVRN